VGYAVPFCAVASELASASAAAARARRTVIGMGKVQRSDGAGYYDNVDSGHIVPSAARCRSLNIRCAHVSLRPTWTGASSVFARALNHVDIVNEAGGSEHGGAQHDQKVRVVIAFRVRNAQRETVAD